MPKQSLEAFGNSSSDYLRMFAVAEGKVGKTTYLAASCLGALPHQTKGLVDKPENLHILGFDEAFVDGLLRFITETCKKPKDYLKLNIWDFTEEVRKSAVGEGWNYALYNEVQKAYGQIKQEMVQRPGVHAIIASSLTGLAVGIEAGLAGAPQPGKKGAGMDQSKWGSFSHQLSHLRSIMQTETHHMFWEGHVTKTSGATEEDRKETVSISGKTGQNWNMNVDQTVRLRREMAKYPNSKVDKVFMETRPSLDFVSNGRGFNEALDAREYDIVVMAEKLGKKVGGYTGPATTTGAT